MLIYDETGNFVRHSEYENLKSVSPVKLPIGQYTFAYLSNIKSDLISGIQEDKKLEDITLSLEESEGNVLSAGSIFKGIDTSPLGKDSKSNAALQRLVGRMGYRTQRDRQRCNCEIGRFNLDTMKRFVSTEKPKEKASS